MYGEEYHLNNSAASVYDLSVLLYIQTCNNIPNKLNQYSSVSISLGAGWRRKNCRIKLLVKLHLLRGFSITLTKMHYGDSDTRMFC